MATTQPPRERAGTDRTEHRVGQRRAARTHDGSRLRLPHLSTRRLLLQFVGIGVLGLLLLAAAAINLKRLVSHTGTAQRQAAGPPAARAQPAAPAPDANPSVWTCELCLN